MKTIQELIDFCEGIPENQWCRSKFEIKKEEDLIQRCIAGHLNHHLSGNAHYSIPGSASEPCVKILRPLGIDRTILVRVNNSAEVSVKGDVIKYLQSQIKEAA